jgi:SAM-dependent methyltransferase
MSLAPEQLEQISQVTLAHYRQVAEAFREGTRDHDVSQNIAALLRHQIFPAPLRILDVGCGPGRDLITFRELGHSPVGLDGCPEFVNMVRERGLEAWLQDFLTLDLPSETFHGVFANASLFHIPSQELPRVLRQLHQTMLPGAVLFASNPRGDNQEGWNGERYAAYYDWPRWQALVEAAGFTELEHYYRPAGLPREQQPWLASVWRRI